MDFKKIASIEKKNQWKGKWTINFNITSVVAFEKQKKKIYKLKENWSITDWIEQRNTHKQNKKKSKNGKNNAMKEHMQTDHKKPNNIQCSIINTQCFIICS